MKIAPTSPWVRRSIVTFLVLLGLAAFLFGGTLFSSGRETPTMPAFVEEVFPAAGSEVLAQSPVGVDLEAGYTGYLTINGTLLRDDLSIMTELGRIEYLPGPGKEIESLRPDTNCVIATVWPIAQGEDAAQTVSWCFSAA